MDKRGPLLQKIIIVAVMIAFALLLSNLFRFTGFFLLTKTNASLETGNVSFNAVKNNTIYISITKSGVNVTNAVMNLSGQKGLFTGDWFNLNETNTKPLGITMNDTYFWVADSGNSQIYVYDMVGNYISNWSSPNSPKGITQNTTNIWISGPANITYHNITGGLISSFTPTNCTKDVLQFDNNRGITSNSTNVFVITDLSASTTRICTYTHNGTHVRTQDLSSLTAFAPSDTKGIYTNTSNFWVVGGVVSSPTVASIVEKKDYNFGAIDRYVTLFTTTNIIGRGITGNVSNLFLVAYNMSDDQDNPTTPGRVFKMHMDPSFPNNTWLEVGTEDGTYEWQHTGTFDLTNNRTADFSARINNFLSTCTADSYGNCSVPLKLHSDVTGIIDYFGIRISYNDTQAPTLTISPATNKTDVGIGMQTSLSCTATDNIGTPDVKMLIDGSQVCSGKSSCSYTHTMATSGGKTVRCQALDRENNNNTKSIILTGTTPQQAPPTPAPAPSPPSSEPVILPVEEVEETLPLELTPEIKPITIEGITSEIKENKIIINLQERARLKLSFEDGPRKKPRLDMEFSTNEVPMLKQTLVEIAYVDWHYYFNILLIVILIGLMLDTLYKRYS